MASRTKRLLFEIEVAQQRLEHALRTKHTKLQNETQRQLVNLHCMLVDSVKDETPVLPAQPYYLVFCESFQDGRVMSRIEYRTLYKSMSQFDRETHQAIEVDGSSVADLEQALVLDTANANKRHLKRGA